MGSDKENSLKVPVRFSVNGDDRDLYIGAHKTLMEVLRDDLELTGTKEGCGNGNCGACTINLDGKAVNACLILGVEADGHEVQTIEGVSEDGTLHPLQQAFIEESALQCGFCTPGFIMSAKVFLEQNPSPSEQEIRTAIAGNLCRCTGYDKIVRAIQAAAKLA
ncbi:MAG: carbon-monoxide dehydrogenase small subunit [Chloroflexi bacterium]|jgi:carbon-monoxide dehydrogenase small subunit|nr:MAG: carbon-monoxide dehydrogenase small subunit [Chloroflexota bacterium]